MTSWKITGIILHTNATLFFFGQSLGQNVVVATNPQTKQKKKAEIPPFSMAFRCPNCYTVIEHRTSERASVQLNENKWPNTGMIGMCAGSKCVAWIFCYLLSLRQWFFLYGSSLSLGLLPYLYLSTSIHIYLSFGSVVFRCCCCWCLFWLPFIAHWFDLI